MKPTINVATFAAERLTQIVNDLESTPEVLKGHNSRGELPVIDQLLQVREYIQCDEGGLAYEVLVALLEKYSFLICSRSAVGLLEVGLFFQYKTERQEDAFFDHRHDSK